ncbi:MAG: hypothetical protein IT204_03765 [Fimbriimonadaceae bacterium]|nr:hypothetical protein [Fimbriimonadaceae bacterium]
MAKAWRVIGILVGGCCAALAPLHAAQLAAVGQGGGDLLVVLPSGTAVVFEAPGREKTRRDFGAAVIAVDLSPAGPQAVVLKRGADWASLERWDYGTNLVQPVAQELAANAWDVAYAAGGHAILVAGAGGVTVLDAVTLQRRRTIPAPGLPAGEMDLAVGPNNWHVAVATRAALWVGPSDKELQRTEVGLSDGPSPRVRFLPDAKAVIAAGTRAAVVMPVPAGLPRRLPLSGSASSAHVEVSSDGKAIFLAESGRLQVVGVSDGGLRYTATLLPAGARPLALAAVPRFGTVAVLYDHGQVVWARPIPPAVLAAWPTALPTPEPPAGPTPTPPTPPAGATLPAVSADRLAVLRDLLAGGKCFVEVGEGLDVVVLDRNLERLPVLEKAAVEQGWQQLVLALAASAAKRPAALPEPFRPLAAQLLAVDLVQLRNVRPLQETTPGELEALFGPARATGGEVMLPDSRLYPETAFGPFLLPRAGAGFPAGCHLSLAANWLQAWSAGR